MNFGAFAMLMAMSEYSRIDTANGMIRPKTSRCSGCFAFGKSGDIYAAQCEKCQGGE